MPARAPGPPHPGTPLVRVAVAIAPGEEEPGRARMLAAAPGGFEEVSLPGGGVELAAYVTEDAVPGFRAVFPGIVVTTVDADWESEWRAFHHPVVVAGIWIGPPWERSPEAADAVVIDPGRAFGTGAHPTTRLCVELLAALPRGSLVDVGCGSGVVAIAAARLGFGPLVALDVDPVAVETSRANGRVNGVELDTWVADALVDPLPAADVAVANVLLEPVERILARVASGHAITSGYLAGERPRHPGWRHVRTAALDGWAADVFAR